MKTKSTLDQIQSSSLRETKEKSFNNWKHNALHLTFPNGNAISTVWGSCTYSDNRDARNFDEFMESDTVEIMILKAPDRLTKKIQKEYDFRGDSVKGYLNIVEWLDIVNLLAKNP